MRTVICARHATITNLNPGISRIPECLSHEVGDPCRVIMPMACMIPAVYDGWRMTAYGPVVTIWCPLRILSWKVKKRPRVR